MATSSASSQKTLSKIACLRLQNELAEWQVNPPSGLTLKISDDIQRLNGIMRQSREKSFSADPPSSFSPVLAWVQDNSRWVIELRGVPGTLYANETYQLQIDSPEHYPMEPPQVIFLHPAPLHPHIYSNGHICLDILYDSWSPALTVSSVCMSILSMLSSSTVKKRPEGNDYYVAKCRNGRSPKETTWRFHDDKV